MQYLTVGARNSRYDSDFTTSFVLYGFSLYFSAILYSVAVIIKYSKVGAKDDIVGTGMGITSCWDVAGMGTALW